MYFHGIDKIGKHKTDYVTLKELVADFELMDNAVKALQEKAARPQNITESDLKDFEIIKKRKKQHPVRNKTRLFTLLKKK